MNAIVLLIILALLSVALVAIDSVRYFCLPPGKDPTEPKE